jgi:hypothetical protein
MDEFLFRKGGLNMKVKDLSISTKIYSVNEDEIISVSIDAISKINNKIKITIDDYCYDTNKDAEVIKTINDNLFLNFNQAQEEQSRLRKKIIESRFEDMSKAITNYNAAVLKYFNKPLSTLEEL